MQHFLITGGALAAACWLLQRIWRAVKEEQYLPAFFWTLGLMIPGLVFAAYALNHAPQTLSTRKWYQDSPTAELLLFAAMLAGMAASYLTKQIEQRRRQIEDKQNKGDASPTPLDFDLWEFSYPMLVSVITFGAIVQNIGDKLIDVSSIILSFQTGFFWQTVLERSTLKTS